MGEKRKATLHGHQVALLYRRVLSTAVNTTEPHVRKCIDKADDELAAILHVEHSMDGSFTMKVPKEIKEYEFSFEAVFGMKVAFLRAIIGDKPEPRGSVRHTMLPIAKALGIERQFIRDGKLDEQKDDALDLEFDEPEKPEATA